MDIVEREITDAELRRIWAGFDEHGADHGNPVEASQRFSCVAVENARFVGCASGLAQVHEIGYADWFYLTDLFVEKQWRRQGIGHALLDRIEQRVAALGIGHVWTWTAGYEGPGFYLRQGYTVFFEKPKYYASGHARVGLYKRVREA